MEMDEDQHSVEEWCRLIVKEKSINLSDFLTAKRPGLVGTFGDEQERTLTEIVEVVKLFPSDFLQSQEVALLLEFFLSRIESSALAGGAVISGIRHLVINSKNLPNNFEEPLCRLMFKEGNVQSWSQKEREYHYDILKWLLKHRLSYLKAINNDFLLFFIKAINGERDPRCLITVFRMFTNVCENFDLGPFSEEMFETVACYYPIEFKPQPSQKISRNFIASSCAACLVASSSFASFCYMFIDEKLNDSDGECIGEQADDMLELIVLACQRFPPSTIHVSLNEILGGIRSIALHPKDHNKLSPLLINAMKEVVTTASKAGKTKDVLESLVENLEPFVLQAEMGLTHKALVLLRCGYENFPDEEAMVVLKQVIAWIVTLVQGDSVNAAANKVDVIKESLIFLREWITISAQRQTIGKQCLSIFEPTIFAACNFARDYVPTEAQAATFNCAAQFLENDYASNDLVAQVDQLIVTGLRTIPAGEFNEYLYLINALSSTQFEKFRSVFDANSTTTWHPEKVVPILCAASCSHESWDLTKPVIENELRENLNSENVQYFYTMCKKAENDQELVQKFFDLLDEVVLKSPVNKSTKHVAKCLQSIALLLQKNGNRHVEVMNRIFERYENERDNSNIEDIDAKYGLALLQDENKEHLSKLLSHDLPPMVYRKFLFAAINRGSVKVEKLDGKDFEDSWIAFVKVKSLLITDTNLGVLLTRQLFQHILENEESSLTDQQLHYLMNFELDECNPTKCSYNTGSPFWRQKLFYTLVPVYKSVFLENPTHNGKLVGFLSPLLEFAQTLGNSQVKEQFEMLMPVLLESLNTLEICSSNTSVLNAIPKFLAISDPLERSQVMLVIEKLCNVVTGGKNLLIAQHLDALESLEMLAKRQPARSIQPNISTVTSACQTLLSHHKRVIRQKAAVVKNLWEMLSTK